MNKMNDEPDVSTLPPAALRPELTDRFLAAMQTATVEADGHELERRLRHLSPAPVGERRHEAWLCGMEESTAYAPHRHWGRFWRWGAAASLLLCAAGGLFLAQEGAFSDGTAGLACRSVVDSHAEGAVEWQEGQVALRLCDVLYEDSFVLDGDEGSLITVRVPVRTRVLLEEEVI